VIDEDEVELIQKYLKTIINPVDKPIRIKHIKHTDFPEKIFERLKLFKQFSIDGVKYQIVQPASDMYVTQLSPGISLCKYKMKKLSGSNLYAIIALDPCKFMVYSGLKNVPKLILNPGDIHISSQLNLLNIQTPVGVHYISFCIEVVAV
jgi:hypothetical protein